MPHAYTRPLLDVLLGRMREPRRLIQILAGPRQVGKTTLVRQALDRLELPTHYASADSVTLEDRSWIDQQWALGRMRAREHGGAVLALDEVQKVTGWSGAVKRLWDEDTANELPLRVVLLGSAPLLVQSGLSESLAGRFEVIRASHWSLREMIDAFGWGVEEYVFFGGYPGAAPLIDDESRWRAYVLDALVETTLSRDILLMTRIDKPALLRRLFELACHFSGQILSYQKMLGQLQDAGNTTTLAHYLDLLSGAGMVTGLQKFAGGQARRRASSPKLQVLNNGLMAALSGRTHREAIEDGEFWGHMVESAVGAHLLNATIGKRTEVHYWRDRGREVGFVLSAADRLCAVEVKSGRAPTTLPGMDAFRSAFSADAKVVLVGGGGLTLEEFLTTDPERWLA